MSIRTNRQDDSYASAVRKDLSALKATALEASRLDNLDTTVRPEGQEAAAASLGVSPNELKPIGFMNAAHYEQLKAQNALSDDLARRIEAYKVVASSE